MDPIPNRVGLIPARRDLLRALREVTATHGIALIFDEVITFRVATRAPRECLASRRT
ncbi:MAG: hypothetical protein ACRELA_13130 [Candidatus Rokuibacteriota bacterium]